jgi:hypothetical protein
MGLPAHAESLEPGRADHASQSVTDQREGHASEGDGSDPDRETASSGASTPEGELLEVASDASRKTQLENDVEACLRIHEQAQVARLDGDLLEAERHLTSCSAATCPGAVRRDCLRWQEESKNLVPSLIIVATGDTGDVEVAHVFVDEVRVRERLDGRPIRANPGTRVVRVVLPDGRELEKRVVLSEGQLTRRFEFDFRTSPPEEVTPKAPPPVEYARPVPQATYVLGGIAAASAAVSVIFGLDAYIKSRTGRRECAPLCTQDAARAVAERAAVSDVALGVAGASAISASVLYFFRPAVAVASGRDVSVTDIDLSIGAGPRGGSVEVWGQF